MPLFEIILENNRPVELGRGSYGAVFLAKKDGECCAVKKAKRDSSSVTEKSVLEYMTDHEPHPNIINLLFIQETCKEGKDFIEIGLPFCQYDLYTFTRLIKWNNFSPEHVYHLIIQLLSPVYALHYAGWMHGDIKADNYLVSVDGHILLSDYGFATPHYKGLVPCRKTGTVGWMHYLMYEPGCDTFRLDFDIFSACLTFAFVLTGMHPFPTLDDPIDSCKLQKEYKLFHRIDPYTEKIIPQEPKWNVPKNTMNLIRELIERPQFFSYNLPEFMLRRDPLFDEWTVDDEIFVGSVFPIFPKPSLLPCT